MSLRTRLTWWQVALIVLLLPLVIVCAVAAALLFLAWSVCLHIAIWTWWCLRGRDVLFVYSDSPIWREYIETRVLPFLGPRATVLNWSHRKRWSLSLSRMAFYHFGGSRRFNPLAVVFKPFHRTRTFRFWEPFREYKHGRPAALQALQQEFFLSTGIHRPESV